MPPLELRRLWDLDGRKMALWSEPSRRRLRRETRAISQSLAPHIPRSCTHVRGHGGVKGALRQIHRRMPKARFVARFDIAAYYTSMRHDVIEAQVKETDLDAHHRKLIADYLALPDSQGAGVGMVASGGLSPLLGALYLTPLDRRMDRLCKRKGLVGYVRYMDDIVLLARTRWELRRAIAALHEEIATLGLHLHRIKRFIGRTTDTPRRNVRHDSDCRMGPKGFVFEGVSNLRPHRLPPNHVSEFAEMSRLHQPRSRHPSDDVPRLKSNPLSNPRVRRSASHQ